MTHVNHALRYAITVEKFAPKFSQSPESGTLTVLGGVGMGVQSGHVHPRRCSTPSCVATVVVLLPLSGWRTRTLSNLFVVS